jgi:hypothetical protein
MSDRLRLPEYGDDTKVRWVSSCGAFQWKDVVFRAGRLLAGQPLGIRQTADGEWDVLYGPILLGYLLLRNGKPVLERVS